MLSLLQCPLFVDQLLSVPSCFPLQSLYIAWFQAVTSPFWWRLPHISPYHCKNPILHSQVIHGKNVIDEIEWKVTLENISGTGSIDEWIHFTRWVWVQNRVRNHCLCVNYNNSLTWIKAICLSMISPIRHHYQWGRSEVVIICTGCMVNTKVEIRICHRELKSWPR